MGNVGKSQDSASAARDERRSEVEAYCEKTERIQYFVALTEQIYRFNHHHGNRSPRTDRKSYPDIHSVSSQPAPAWLRPTPLDPLIGASYERKPFKDAPVPDGELPYRNNLLPHNRNKLVFEHLHQLADGLGMSPVMRALDNGYFYLEIESKGLSVHIKHRNAYQSLKEQMVKADYRRQMTSINLPFGQMPLFADDKLVASTGQAYVILFYDDSAVKRSEVGDIYFILPSNEEGNILNIPDVDGRKPLAHSSQAISLDIYRPSVKSG